MDETTTEGLTEVVAETDVAAEQKPYSEVPSEAASDEPVTESETTTEVLTEAATEEPSTSEVTTEATTTAEGTVAGTEVLTEAAKNGSDLNDQEAIEVKEYAVFDDIASLLKEDCTSITDSISEMKSLFSQLFNENVFYGPIADKCSDAWDNCLSKINTDLTTLDECYNTIIANKESYQTTDKASSNKVTTL